MGSEQYKPFYLLNDEWPKKVKLTKLETKEDAYIPQKEEYPDNWQITGLIWEHHTPVLGETFVIYQSKLYPSFHTSVIVELAKEGDAVRIDTMNSRYILESNESDKS